MTEAQILKLEVAKGLVVLLMEDDNSLTLESALDIVFNSDTYRKLMEDKTALYYQSPRYVFSFLRNEIKYGRMA